MSKKAPVKKRGKGRPPKYKEEYAEQARKLCGSLGATDEQLAEFFEVDTRTIYRWKNNKPNFCQAIKSKDDADRTVEESLYHTALDGNTTAQIFWLKNRQPKRWRDKQEVDHTTNGKDITGIEVTFVEPE